MPKPNYTEEIECGTIEFGRLGRRVVEGRFDGGSMTSDGVVMRLGEVDRKIGLVEAASRCKADPRCPLLIKHSVRDMLRQRVYGLALDWEDLSDHGALREDVAVRRCRNFCVRSLETCPRRRASLATNARRGGQVGATSYAAVFVKRSSLRIAN